MADAAAAWLALVFPGGADLVTGETRRAAWTALLAWCAVLAAVALSHASAARSTPWFVSLHPVALRVALGVFWLLWLPGLLRLRHHRPRRDPAIPGRA
jgi:membrane protein YdbS with pleckstrin-like domain